MTKTLQMIFRNAAGKQITLSLAEPKDTITLAEVQTLMQDIVTKNIFTSTGGDLVQVVDARIATRDTAALS